METKTIGFSGVGEDHYEEVSKLYAPVSNIPSTQYAIDEGQPLITGAVTTPIGSVNLSTMPKWGWITIAILALLAMRR